MNNRGNTANTRASKWRNVVIVHSIAVFVVIASISIIDFINNDEGFPYAVVPPFLAALALGLPWSLLYYAVNSSAAALTAILFGSALLNLCIHVGIYLHYQRSGK